MLGNRFEGVKRTPQSGDDSLKMAIGGDAPRWYEQADTCNADGSCASSLGRPLDRHSSNREHRNGDSTGTGQFLEGCNRVQPVL